MDLGSLSASINLDSSNFEDGLSSASDALQSFASIAAGSFAGVEGAIAANAIGNGLSSLSSFATGTASAFQDFTTATSVGLGDTSDAADTFSGAIGGSGTSALEAADALDQYNEKIASIQQNIADVMAGTNITDAVSKYNETLESDQESYADKVTSINQQIADAQAGLLQTEADNAQSMNDTLQDMSDSQADKMADTKEKQAQTLADTTSAVERAALEKQYAQANQLEEDSYNRAYATKQAELSRNLAQEDAKAQTSANQKIATYQNELAAEATAENQKEAKLKEDMDTEVANDEAANKKKLAQYQQELADEERSYAESVARRAASGGGGASTSYMALLPKGADREVSGVFSAIAESLKGILSSTMQLATTSPFPLSDIEQANQKLKATHLNVEKMDPAMANFAVVTGRSLTSVASMMDTTIHGRGMAILNALNLGAGDLSNALGRPIKSANDIAQALTEIGTGTSKNTALNERFKNASKDMGETYTGQLNIVNNELALTANSILGINNATGKIDPKGAFAQLQKGAAEFTEYLISHQSEIVAFGKNFISGMEEVGKVVGDIAGFIIKHWEAIKFILLTVGIAFGVIIPIMQTIIGIVASVQGIILALSGAAGVASQAFVLLGISALADIAVFILIALAVAALVAFIITHWTQIKAVTMTVFKDIGSFLSSFWSGVVAGWHIAISTLTSAIQNFLKTLKTEWDSLPKIVQGAIALVIAILSGFQGQLLQWGINLADAFIKGFINELKKLPDQLGSVLNNIMKFIKGLSPPAEGPLHEIDKWGENIGSAWTGGFQKALGGFSPNFGSIGSGLGSPTQNYNSVSNMRTNNVTLNNAFNINGSGSAANVAEYLSFQAKTSGIV